MLLINGSLFTVGHFVKADVRICDGLISEIGIDLAPNGGEQIIDCEGLKILPGLFDIHTHGCIGHDFSEPDPDGYRKMCDHYSSHGVTSVLATTMTGDPELTLRACSEIGRLIDEQESSSSGRGAMIRGINAEGPFISRDRKGAHDVRFISPISQEYLDRLREASGDRIRLMTVAPELDGALEFIRLNSVSSSPAEPSDPSDSESTPSGIHISIGHSACDYDMAFTAFDYGADHVTHLFNAMDGLSHRAPGIPGAAFDRHIYTELICDGLHVHPSVVRMMFKSFSDRIVLISDSIKPAGMPDGKYMSGGLDVTVSSGEIRLPDGTLAGSGITLFEGLRRAISFGVPEEQAIMAATYNPAASLGLENVTGSICPGHAAEILLVTKAWDIEAVIINDTISFSNM